jgi:hypothetical protein
MAYADWPFRQIPQFYTIFVLKCRREGVEILARENYPRSEVETGAAARESLFSICRRAAMETVEPTG